MDIGIVQELFKIEAARARGESVSEFKIARLYVDSMWIELNDMLVSGVPKPDVVGVLMITARVSRTAAYNTLTNKINADQKRRKNKNEVSAQGIAVEKNPHQATVPLPHMPESKPAKPTKPAQISAPPQLSHAHTETKTEPARLGSIKIGNNFHGVDDVGKRAEQDAEIRAKTQANIDAMEKKFGSPLIFKQQENQDA